jgi:hypothetical protein
MLESYRFRLDRNDLTTEGENREMNNSDATGFDLISLPPWNLALSYLKDNGSWLFGDRRFEASLKAIAKLKEVGFGS